MFIALFIISKNQKQPTYLLTDDCIHKMWYIHTVEYYLVIKSNEILTYAMTWMNIEILC